MDKTRSKANFDGMRRKLAHKLTGWKVETSSVAGKVVLLNVIYWYLLVYHELHFSKYMLRDP